MAGTSAGGTSAARSGASITARRISRGLRFTCSPVPLFGSRERAGNTPGRTPRLARHVRLRRGSAKSPQLPRCVPSFPRTPGQKCGPHRRTADGAHRARRRYSPFRAESVSRQAASSPLIQATFSSSCRWRSARAVSRAASAAAVSYTAAAKRSSARAGSIGGGEFSAK